MMDSNLYKQISKALSICFPETKEENAMNCEDCPYIVECTANDGLGITVPIDVFNDIKHYFSNNWTGNIPLQ